jgi:uncharacterized protein YndB with AHSA1/START domain
MADERQLSLTRDIPVSPDKLYRCWTDPALIVRWFTPPPYVTTSAKIDLRPGGASTVTMRAPDGSEFPNRGVYLEVVPNRRLVSTDAYTTAWQPSDKPFLTIELSFDDLGNGSTRYTAICHHWSVADREAHEGMGFHAGWGVATDQLAALAATL